MINRDRQDGKSKREGERTGGCHEIKSPMDYYTILEYSTFKYFMF